MTGGLFSQRVLLAVAGIGMLSGAALWLREPASSRHETDGDYPPLFDAGTPCGADVQTAKRAIRFEEQGHLHAERYPYDPRDGIRAVVRFQRAYSCYRDATLQDDAGRAKDLALALMIRINIDYASSRLALESALASEQWAVALEELRRLLRLTGHLRGHDYVEGLWSLVGRVTVHAARAS